MIKGNEMRQNGRIARFLMDRGFGFILSSETGEEYFFHMSQFSGTPAELTKGTHVSFELGQSQGRTRAEKVSVEATGLNARRRHQIGPYSGPNLELSDEARRQALTEISRWKLEARLDDMKRYFFTVPELQQITTGDASYVIGRKGTGKTALVQYLSEQPDPDLLVTKLTFKNFPFNELYSQANDGYTRPNQYITIWKLIIYSAACRLIASSRKTDPLIRQAIDKAFPPTESDNLGTIVGKWIAGDFGLTVLGSGINVSKWFKEKNKYQFKLKLKT